MIKSVTLRKLILLNLKDSGELYNETKTGTLDIQNVTPSCETPLQKVSTEDFYYVATPTNSKPPTANQTIILIDDDDDDNCNNDLIFFPSTKPPNEAASKCTKTISGFKVRSETSGPNEKRPLPYPSHSPSTTKKLVVMKEGLASQEKVVELGKTSINNQPKEEVKLRPLKSFWGPFTGL